MTDGQSKITIRAVKLKRKGDEGFIPEITVHDTDMKLDKTYANCENLCHSDFTKAVKRLNNHIAVLTDRLTTDDFEMKEEIDEIIVARGYSLSGAENELRVTLKGYYKTTRGRTYQINILEYLDVDDEEKEYALVDDLKEKLKRIELEARLYIFEAKKYEDPQLSLTLPDPPDPKKKVTRAKIAEPTPESVVKDIVDAANGGKDKPGKGVNPKKGPQTAANKTGDVK